MNAITETKLAAALHLSPREVVAFVGAGGKTTALHMLADELAAADGVVVVTTTTAMFRHQMTAVGPLLLESDGDDMTDRLRRTLAAGRPVAVAHGDGARGKVIGISPAAADRLWAEGLADCLIVEADGSRGLPLKAFGAHEPQVPATATTIVAVAGMDALGSPLDDDHVHRAASLASIVGLPLGSEVNAHVMFAALRAQVLKLRRDHPGGRVVVLLNKADSPRLRTAGFDVAHGLLADAADAHDSGGAHGTGGPYGTGGRGVGVLERTSPDVVVVGSLSIGRFSVVTRAA